MSKNLNKVRAFITNKVNNENITNKDMVIKNYVANASKIMEELSSKSISFTLEEKEGWGMIFVFELKGKKVFTNYFKRGKMQVFYYSDNYSCKGCKIKF